jgi:hypothetical protein
MAVDYAARVQANVVRANGANRQERQRGVVPEWLIPYLQQFTHTVTLTLVLKQSKLNIHILCPGGMRQHVYRASSSKLSFSKFSIFSCIAIAKISQTGYFEAIDLQ